MASSNALLISSLDRHFDLPIAQLARHKGTRFQLGFARHARALIPPHDGFALSATARGLNVLARNEDGLAEPVNRLREAYGPSLELGPPTVRVIAGARAQEPVMQGRVIMETRYQEAVKRALLEREATLEEEHARSRQALLRFEAPLARLLGLPAELKRLTGDTARYWIVLSHYAPVMPDPGGRAA